MLVFLLAAAEPALLSLTCTGAVTVQATESTSSAQARDNLGNTVTANGVTTAPAKVNLTVNFEMQDGAARVYLPAEMRPDFSKTKDGWFPVTDLSVTEQRITGQVKLNFLRSTLIEIDRNTGIMTTKHGYRAECAVVDRTVRKF